MNSLLGFKILKVLEMPCIDVMRFVDGLTVFQKFMDLCQSEGYASHPPHLSVSAAPIFMSLRNFVPFSRISVFYFPLFVFQLL